MTRKVRAYEVFQEERLVASGSVEECAKQLGVSKGRVYQLANKANMKLVKEGKSKMYAQRIEDKVVPRVSKYDYAIYRGDKFITVGDLYDVAKEVGLKPEQIPVLTSPSYQESVKEDGTALIAIKLEKEEDDEWKD